MRLRGGASEGNTSSDEQQEQGRDSDSEGYSLGSEFTHPSQLESSSEQSSTTSSVVRRRIRNLRRRARILLEPLPDPSDMMPPAFIADVLLQTGLDIDYALISWEGERALSTLLKLMGDVCYHVNNRIGNASSILYRPGWSPRYHTSLGASGPNMNTFGFIIRRNNENIPLGRFGVPEEEMALQGSALDDGTHSDDDDEADILAPVGASAVFDDGTPEFFARANANLHKLAAYLTADPGASRSDGEYMLTATPERSWSFAFPFPIPLALAPFIKGVKDHNGEILTQHIGMRLPLDNARTVRCAFDGGGVVSLLDMAKEVACMHISLSNLPCALHPNVLRFTCLLVSGRCVLLFCFVLQPYRYIRRD